MTTKAFSELADRINSAKSEAGTVLDAWPASVEGASDLEHAIELLGNVERELDDAAEDL